MAEKCPDHGIKSHTVCINCVRPMCRKCPTKGSVDRCQECQQALDGTGPAQQMPRGGRTGDGPSRFGPFVFFLLMVLVLFLWGKGCPIELPFGLEWRH